MAKLNPIKIFCKVVAKVEKMKGVKEAKWNPRTREVTVIYDAKVTSARHIKHFVA